MEYINEICQGCGRKFSDGDDIVVCPDCGTPQHRECYNKEHKCVNEHLHSDNYEWKPKHAPIQPTATTVGSESITCPFCGHENEKDAKMCENCGQPFELFGRSILPDDNINQPKDTPENYEYKPPFEVGEFKPSDNAYRGGENNGDNGQSSQPFIADAYAFGNDIPNGETCGVSNRDIKLYVRTSPSAYYKKFKAIENKKPTFNVGALIFGHLWFFFRKLYKPGIIFMTLYLCLTFAFYNPIMSVYGEMADLVTQVQQAGENVDTAATEAQISALTEKSMPTLMAFIGLNLALNLVMAFTADRLYKRKAVKDIKDTNDRTDGNDRMKIAEFMKKGGSSFVMALTGYFIQYLITSIITGVFFQ